MNEDTLIILVFILAANFVCSLAVVDNLRKELREIRGNMQIGKEEREKGG